MLSNVIVTTSIIATLFLLDEGESLEYVAYSIGMSGFLSIFNTVLVHVLFRTKTEAEDVPATPDAGANASTTSVCVPNLAPAAQMPVVLPPTGANHQTETQGNAETQPNTQSRAYDPAYAQLQLWL